MLILRRAVLTHLKATSPLTGLVPAAQMYPQMPVAEPVWPFLRYGEPVSIPREAACLNGADVSFIIHTFAKPRYQASGAMIETAEDHCQRIAAAVEDRLHRARLAIDGGHIVIRRGSTSIVPDGDTADAVHGIINFRAKVTV